MNKGISIEFKILLVVIILLAGLAGLLFMSIYPVELKIMAVVMKYCGVFLGSGLLITVVFSRIVDGLLAKHKE